MKILDVYILKKYLSTFVFVVVIVIAVVMVIDYTEKNEDFISKHVPLRSIAVDYYLNFIPYVANLLSPLLIFISTVFVTARLASRTEIIAILASGVNLFRILVPYLLGSGILAVMVFYMNGWVIPKANHQRHQFENQYVRGKFFFDKRNVHFKVSPQSYVYLESYNNSINCGYTVSIETIVDGKVLDKISAARMLWLNDKGKWRLEYWRKHSFDGMNETMQKGDFLDTSIHLKPADFETQHMLYEQLTLDQLNAHIQLLSERGAENIEPYLVEKYERFAYPFAIIILTIIGVIVSARKSRQGVGAQIALGFVLAFVYILFLLVGRSLANVGGLSPAMTAWIPNGVFALIGAVMYFRLPK